MCEFYLRHEKEKKRNKNLSPEYNLKWRRLYTIRTRNELFSFGFSLSLPRVFTAKKTHDNNDNNNGISENEIVCFYWRLHTNNFSTIIIIIIFRKKTIKKKLLT